MNSIEENAQISEISALKTTELTLHACQTKWFPQQPCKGGHNKLLSLLVKIPNSLLKLLRMNHCLQIIFHCIVFKADGGGGENYCKQGFHHPSHGFFYWLYDGNDEYSFMIYQTNCYLFHKIPIKLND